MPFPGPGKMREPIVAYAPDGAEAGKRSGFDGVTPGRKSGSRTEQRRDGSMKSDAPITLFRDCEAVEKLVWERLRTCFDPEIPVNIVDLGLIYHCRVTALSEGGHKVEVQFTLTAQGCGMGEILKVEIQDKIMGVPGVKQVHVELVWDPPWNQSMISEPAKLQLGMV